MTKITISEEGSNPISITLTDNNIKSEEGLTIRNKKYDCISQFLNDPDLKTQINKTLDIFKKKKYTPMSISEFRNLSKEELKECSKFLSKYTLKNAKSEIYGYHTRDIVPKFGSILECIHYIDNVYSNYICCKLYGIFKTEKSKIGIKKLATFMMPYSNSAFDVPFSDKLK